MDAIIRSFRTPEEVAAWNEEKHPMMERSTWTRQSPELPVKPVRVLIRDPVARFSSAMQQVRISDVDAAIAALSGGPNPEGYIYTEWTLPNDYHFAHQHPHTQTGMPTFLYRFPDHIDDLAVDAGIMLPLPHLNVKSVPKPVLNDVQAQAVRAYYAADVALFNSIKEKGQVL